MLLDSVNSTVIGVICYALKPNVEGVLTKHGYQKQILQVIGNASLFSAIKDNFYTFIVDN